MAHAIELTKEILAELTEAEMDEIKKTLDKLKKEYLENKWSEDGGPVDGKYGFRVGHLNCKQRLWLTTNGYKVYNYWDNYSGNNVITLCLYK